MKKWLTLVLAIAICLVPMSAFAIDYPVDSGDVTLIMWKQLDGSIAEGGYTTSNETPGFMKWVEDTGIKVEIQEYTDSTSLVLALNGASTLPAMYTVDAVNFGGVMSMVNEDMVIEITPEMLEENAPDYWAYINQPMYMDLIQELDGNMYYFAGHVFEGNSIYRFWRGFFYRQDILQKAGWEKFPETIDEFYQCLVDLKAAGVTTPLVFQGKDDLREMLKNGDITSPFGLVCANEYQTDGTWYHGATQPEYKDVLAFMHKLYEEGLISVDYLSMENATSQSMLCTGEAAIFYGNNSRLSTFKSSVEDGGWLYPGAPLVGEGQERAMFTYADPFVAGDRVFISPDCANPELVLQFLNYLYTEPGNLLRNFGTEGKSYEIVDGVPRYTEFITNNPDGHALDGMARSWGLINWPGIHADVMNAQRHPEDTQVIAYELWSNSDHDLHAITHTDVLDEYVDEYANLWVDIDLYINECRAKFISGEMDIENEFDAYIDHLKSMGMDRVAEIKQATLDAYNAR